MPELGIFDALFLQLARRERRNGRFNGGAGAGSGGIEPTAAQDDRLLPIEG